VSGFDVWHVGMTANGSLAVVLDALGDGDPQVGRCHA
jgi:hypothetical protein